MASNYKSTSQLLSIYKLDFYKNKKKWKLYEDVKKESPPSSKTKAKLNKTYSLGAESPEPEYEEQVSQHNRAFLHEEPEDGQDPQLPDVALPDPVIPDAVPPDPIFPDPAAPDLRALDQNIQNLYRPHSWPDQPWTELKSDALWQDGQQEWFGAKEVMREELDGAFDQCDGPCHQHNLWTPASHFELKPAVDPLDLQPEYLTPSQMLLIAEEWLQQHGCPVQQEEYSPHFEEYGLLDDSADFVRGAHDAPHSSEIDLSLTQECQCAYSGRLFALSVRQLARAVRAHHSALAQLLREQALRDALSSRSHLHPPIPFEDYPTRDTDPLRPPDWVLSGSHRVMSDSQQVSDTGRGRGRLHQAHRLIGIGMGRPYRL